ncbi:hypothetical protein POM88_011235 [Heracleum sosnowskyi]|uniref:AAA+ ATPase domain-containing protein n=1 Tax=Heracleum sosnowskyi TaxID=360622 RepID=A0AAD8N0L4_9APIA|nr:hypothetical protein POM88_011235 [Heracleum sosnowskyi]
MKGAGELLQDVLLYTFTAALSYWVIVVGFRELNSDREASKKALEAKKDIARRLGRHCIKTNPYEDVIACDVINPDHIEVEFDSIGGLETIKQSLHEFIILPFSRPELFSQGKLLSPQKGVLLFGPPGTGKTMLAKAIAKESRAVFINVRLANLMSNLFGDAQKLVSAVFSLAHKLQPAIIFIDEVDRFLGQCCSKDDEHMRSLKTRFMDLWDGFTTDRNARVMVLAATNCPSELDEAILRRFPHAFEIEVPDHRERVDILKVILKGEKVDSSIDLDHIAGLCDGYSGSDLLDVCKRAAYFPIRDHLNAEKLKLICLEPRPLSQTDLEKVLADDASEATELDEVSEASKQATKGIAKLDQNQEVKKKALDTKMEIAKRLGRPLIETNPYEDIIACDVINPDHIKVKFDSIGGLESVKQSLHELVILPLRRPELFSHRKLLGPQKGVLLHGPPGTGKTMLAKAIAKESGAVFINVRIAKLKSKWYGEAEKIVSAVFSLAHKLQPSIIFIDEVDSFLGQRRSRDHEVLTSMKTEFMSLWDGLTTDQNARVMVLAATNRPSELDEAIRRRLPQTFKVGLPDHRGRVDILKVVLKGEKVGSSIDLDHISGLCDGYSGSDLFELCKQAAYFPIRDLLNAEKSGLKSSEPRPLSQTDLEKVISTKRKTEVSASEYCNSMYI